MTSTHPRHSECRAEEGQVNIQFFKAGWVIGGSYGKGVLSFRGEQYLLKVGGLKAYGLDYPSLSADHPGLIYCSITGFGQTGPYAPRAGYDFLAQGMGGIMSITGHPDGEPTKVGVAVTDIVTGHYLKEGDQLQITLEAVEVENNRTRWRDTLNVAALDMISMRGQITAKVRQGLVPALGASTASAETGTRPRNEEAYDLYLRSVSVPHDPQPNKEAISMLERAVGFLWHNTGRRALERGEALRAAESFLEESKLEPLEASRTETVGMFLARAFRLDYEAGNFGEAYRIAEIGMEIFPGQTTARDRMLAATLKRIEGACEAGQADAAEEILNQAAASVKSPVDIRRLERGSCPTIAAAAVRAEDWERAGRMALRFNAAELDGVESRRLSRWVARRQREAQERERENACSEVPANSYESPLLSVVDLPTPAAPGSAD